MNGFALRASAALIAVAGALLLAADARDARSCRDARQTAFVQGAAGQVRAQAVRDVEDSCSDSEQVALTAIGLRGRAPEEAYELARTAHSRDPGLFTTEAALAVTSPDSAEAQRAWREARRVNPRSPVPRPVSAP